MRADLIDDYDDAPPADDDSGITRIECAVYGFGFGVVAGLWLAIILVKGFQ